MVQVDLVDQLYPPYQANLADQGYQAFQLDPKLMINPIITLIF